jgi:hypothetical protein
MSVNQRHAIDRQRTKRYGRLWHTIDFELKDKISVDRYEQNPNQIPIGDFIIGEKRFTVTAAELKYIAETAMEASNTFIKAVKLGQFK